MWLVQSSKNQNEIDLDHFEEDGKYNFAIFNLKPINHDISICNEQEFFQENDKILFRFKRLDK